MVHYFGGGVRVFSISPISRFFSKPLFINFYSFIFIYFYYLLTTLFLSWSCFLCLCLSPVHFLPLSPGSVSVTP